MDNRVERIHEAIETLRKNGLTIEEVAFDSFMEFWYVKANCDKPGFPLTYEITDEGEFNNTFRSHLM